MKILISCLLLIMLVSCAPNSERLKTLHSDAAWCWFSDPRAIVVTTEGEKSLVSGGVSEDGSIVAFSYDIDTGTVNKGLIFDKLEKDDHNNPTFLESLDGHILAFYTRHHKDVLFMSKSSFKSDISKWGKARILNPVNERDQATYGVPKYTYANPFRLSREDNRIYLFGRWSGFKPTVVWSDDDGETWSESQVVICPRPFRPGNRPYVKYYSDGRSRIHFAFTDGHPRNEPTNSIYYAYYEKGGFYRADGEKICNVDELPFDPAEATIVYNAKKTGERAWVHDVKVDGRGKVHIAYARFPDEETHQYYMARFDGKKWNNQFICNSGKWFPETQTGTLEREPHYSGGITINEMDTSVVYLSREVGGVFEIEKWFTKDQGITWQHKSITQGSKFNQVRPVSVWGAEKTMVLWMENRKYIHFKNFSSSIVMSLSP